MMNISIEVEKASITTMVDSWMTKIL